MSCNLLQMIDILHDKFGENARLTAFKNHAGYVIRVVYINGDIDLRNQIIVRGEGIHYVSKDFERMIYSIESALSQQLPYNY